MLEDKVDLSFFTVVLPMDILSMQECREMQLSLLGNVSLKKQVIEAIVVILC